MPGVCKVGRTGYECRILLSVLVAGCYPHRTPRNHRMSSIGHAASDSGWHCGTCLYRQGLWDGDSEGRSLPWWNINWAFPKCSEEARVTLMMVQAKASLPCFQDLLKSRNSGHSTVCRVFCQQLLTSDSLPTRRAQNWLNLSDKNKNK